MRTGNDKLSTILFKSSEFEVDTMKSINLHPFGESFAGELSASSQEIKNGKSVLDFIEAIEEEEDVQNVYANFVIQCYINLSSNL